MTDKPTYKVLEQKIKELEKSRFRHKQREEELPDSETLFRAITNQSGEGISLADAEGHYVFVNPAFCKTTVTAKQNWSQ